MKRILIALALIAAMGGTVARASADTGTNGQGAGAHRLGRRMARIAAQLDLTQAQQQQIRSMIKADRPTVRPLVQQLAQERTQMEAATQNGNFDESKVKAIADQQSQTIAQLIVERQRLMSQVYKDVLTPEQRTKADAMREKRDQRLSQRLQSQPAAQNSTNE